MSPDKATAEPAEPWRSFLRELDACLTGQVELRCFGGFVVAQHYGLGRETSDIDFVADYAQRLTHMFPKAPWTRLKLFALDATDLALSKLERNAERDRDDFLRLARAGLLDLEAFKGRYFEEVRPYLLGNLPWHDKTVELWLTMASTPRLP
jgi:hypothetical protein